MGQNYYPNVKIKQIANYYSIIGVSINRYPSLLLIAEQNTTGFESINSMFFILRFYKSFKIKVFLISLKHQLRIPY